MFNFLSSPDDLVSGQLLDNAFAKPIVVHAARTFSAHEPHRGTDRVPIMVSTVRPNFADLSEGMDRFGQRVFAVVAA